MEAERARVPSGDPAVLLVRVLAAGALRRPSRPFSLRLMPLGLWVALGFGVLSLGLLVGSLLLREWSGVPGFLLGLVPAAVVALSLQRLRRAPERDESRVVRLDLLREQTRANHFGSLAPGVGRTGWLTASGVYLDSGEYQPWERFSGFSLDWSQPWVYRITLPGLRPSPFQALRASFSRPVLLFLVALGPLIEAGTALAGFHRYGLHNDVLAALFACIGLLAAATFAAREVRGCLRLLPPKPFVGLINARTLSYDEIHATLNSYFTG